MVLAVGLMGCGRVGFGEGDPAGDDGSDGGNITNGIVDATSLAPTVCERLPNLGVASSANVDLSIATTPVGIAAIWVPVSGGDLMGMGLWTTRVAGPVTTVKIGAFTASSAAYIDDKLIAAGVSTSRALIYTVPQPLGLGTEIGNFDGEFVGKTTLAHSGSDRVTATSCSSGLTMNAFDSAWNGSAGTLSVTTAQTQNIDLTPIATQSFAVWSTSSSCHYETITSKTTGSTRQSMSKACLAARLTSRGTEVGMVFEDGSGSGLVIDEAATISVANAIAIAGASSPRVLWDGTRYWVTYLQADHFVIGYVDGTGMLQTTQLPDAVTYPKAYELGMLDGQPWLFTVGSQDKTLSAARLCPPI